MVALMVASLSFANNSPSVFSIKNGANKVWIGLNLAKVGEQLSIKDVNGTVLYNEIIEEKGVYSKGFDLTSLPDGEYVFELDRDVKISSIPFSVKSGLVKFYKEKETTIFKPVLIRKNNLVYLTKLALNNEPLTVKVYFTSSNNKQLMFSEKIGGTKTIEKTFMLTGIDKGKYTFVMESDGRIFKEVIN